jgi:hypothetical protein
VSVVRRLRRLPRRWWWLVGWAFPNLYQRHHLAEQADRARRSDLPWYGVPPDAQVERSLGGMSGAWLSGRRDGPSHASTTQLNHGSPDGSSLLVTVHRRQRDEAAAPLARLALPLVRDAEGMTDGRWSAHTREEFRALEEQALAELVPQPLTVLVDGTARIGQRLEVGQNWAAFIAMPEEPFDLTLGARGWTTDNLSLTAVHDLDPYIAGSRREVGPLLLPRRPRLNR